MERMLSAILQRTQEIRDWLQENFRQPFRNGLFHSFGSQRID